MVRCSRVVFRILLSCQVVVAVYIIVHLEDKTRNSSRPLATGTGNVSFHTRDLVTNPENSTGAVDNQTTVQFHLSERQTRGSLCSESPEKLVGSLKIDLFPVRMAETSGENHDVELGGHWSPRDCLARSRVIIIIPYRDRLDHLKRWLHHYHPILKRQLLDYRVVVTEQYGNGIFNKGRIMNAAFLECRKAYRFDCVIFHDVDMLLENDRNMYVCGNDTSPKHLSPAVDQFHYKLFYLGLVGGVLAIPVNTFVTVNGYSNQFWGWGGEDDDMWERFVAVNATVKRPPLTIGRYTMNKHASRRGQANYTMIYPLLKTSRSRMRSDGLNNISYSLVTVKLHRLYTHLVFDVDTSAS